MSVCLITATNIMYAPAAWQLTRVQASYKKSCSVLGQQVVDNKIIIGTDA